MEKKKTVEFRGRVVSSEYDFQPVASDVTGFHEVWYPKSRTDLARAIKLLQNQNIFIRSGIQVAKQDIVDGTGGTVINLKELVKIAINEDEVKAEAAATIEMITEYLVEHDLVLPLSDNSLKSIVSNVLSEDASYLMRSLGSLSDYVSKIRAVKRNGVPVTFSAREGVSAVDQCRDSNVIITQVEFKAVSSKNLWMFQKTFPYPSQDHFLEIAKKLFLNTEISEQTDLALEAYNGQYNIPLIRISTLGYSKGDNEKMEDIVKQALLGVLNGFEEYIVEEKYFGSDVLDAMLESGLGTALDPTIDSEKLDIVVEANEDLGDFLSRYAEEVHRKIIFEDSDSNKLDRDHYLFSRLQVNRNNKLEVTGYVHTSSPIIEEEADSGLSPRSIDARTSRSPLESTSIAGPIPNFRGEVYQRKDRGYNSRIKQYATSSYPASKMTPFMVAYPRDADDITAAILFAKNRDERTRIVARSGGHQYSGKSSGGLDTIVLSMDAFTKREISNENIAEIGSAIKLTSLAKYFKSKGITVPHGECPYVAIGGHTQTGGYGHLLRNFGLILDHVLSFDIVLADGTQQTVTHPSSTILSTISDEKLNREIFWGVLGGNAGSFGIVTNYKFKVVKDIDYPNSYGFSMTRRYRKELFFNLMKEVQKWTKGVEDGTLSQELDFMMTVTSSSGRVPFAPLIAELVHSNLQGKESPTSGHKEVNSMIKTASSGINIVENILTKKGKKSLSSLSNSFVRRWPGTTLDGREFRHPYKKRVNCTMKALTDTFVEELVKIITQVVNTSGVKLVFQMSIGGGVYQNTDNRQVTSIPHRDYVYCFVFDLFYKNGYKITAIEFQDAMQKIIDAHFNNDQERRVFWGSFDDTDISKQEVRQMYYDSEEQYVRLQKLKKEVDFSDLFHTELTVQLPTSTLIS